MTNTQKFLNKLEDESATTRKFLSIVPDDKFDWQPHPKSMTIRRLTTHIAELGAWPTIALTSEGIDFANNLYPTPTINSRAELLDYFEQSLSKGKASLQSATDEELKPEWTMRSGDHIINVRPKEDVIQVTLDQMIHHRAQLGVYLRLLNVAIPGSYGPSADELGM